MTIDIINFIGDLRSFNYNREIEFLTIYKLLKDFNFRIGEVLKLDVNCLIHPNTIIVKIEKSKEYYVFIHEGYYYLLNLIFKNNYNLSFSVTYQEFYRWIKKHHETDIISEANKNSKVTHSFRYKNALNFVNKKMNEKQIQALLKHSSKKSQKYYIKNI
jgi:hypothetical protein